MNFRFIGITLMLVLLAALIFACSSPAAVNVGETAPAFSLPSVDGQIVALDDFTGEPVLLYFHMAMG